MAVPISMLEHAPTHTHTTACGALLLLLLKFKSHALRVELQNKQWH